MIFQVDHVFLVVSKGRFADCVKILRLKFVNWLIDSYVICRIYPLPATEFTTSPWSSLWEANSSSAIRELLYAFFWVITQKKSYNIQNTAKVWNQE